MDITIRIQVPERPSLHRPRRRQVAALLLIAALVAPATVVGSHLFPDVSDANPFHNDISRVYGARVAAGCGGGNYCPSSNVTREQMAAFLSRVGSRAAFGQYSTNHALAGADVELQSVTIRAGNVTGGTAFVVVDASAGAYITSTTGCPCQVLFYVQHVGGNSGLNTYFQLDTLAGTYAIDGGSVSEVFAVPTGVDQTFKVFARRFAGTGAIQGWAQMTAIYAPFGNQGGNTVGADAPTSQGNPLGN